MPPGSSTMAPSMSALVSISSTRMPFCVPICLSTMKVPTGITSTARHATETGGCVKIVTTAARPVVTAGAKSHQLDQLHRAFQTPVETAVDVAGHVGAEIGQRRYQQRERGPLARGFFRLGGGILHDEPSRHLDELVDDVDNQNGRQNRRDRGKRGVLPRQHMVRQVADGQRREPAERRRDGQNQQNQKKAFCFRGGRAKMLFQIFGLLHNAHDPFHVAQAMVARIILPHIGDRENGRVRS